MTNRYSFGGDEHIFVEVDESMSLEAFFKALSITNAVRESRIDGVTEICPANASFQIKFDPDRIKPDDMLAELKRLEAAAAQAPSVIETRIFEFPVYYNDPWTHETLMRFRDRHQDPSATDLDYAARINNKASVEEFIAAHSGAPWFVSMVGFSVPTFFTGVVFIVIFSVNLQWFPSIYDTQLEVTDWSSFWQQVRQMVMPVSVLALYSAAQLSRFVRASMLDNLNQDYVRTARAKGMKERVVLLVHVLRNSLIPVVTVIALGIPTIFSGAIITEQIFRVNGLGQLLIIAIQGADIPLVQTLTFIFAVLIVLFNLIADLLYGILDPRIRYD